MAYCTQVDILDQISETELIALSDDESTGDINPDIVDRAIADADAEIDPYLMAKYTLPLTSGLDIIRKLSVDIAIYNLFGRRSNPMPENRDRRYNAAIAMLTHLAKGTIALGDSQPAPLTDGGPKASRPKTDRIFTTGASSSGAGTLDNY